MLFIQTLLKSGPDPPTVGKTEIFLSSLSLSLLLSYFFHKRDPGSAAICWILAVETGIAE